MEVNKSDGTLVSARGDEGTRSVGSAEETQAEAPSSRLQPASGSPDARSPRPLLDTDRFLVREVIGIGGMGHVVRAWDTELRREVAIKLPAPEHSIDPADIERFVNEARITGQLQHPYIVPVYELGIDRQGTRFLSMRLLAGETLEATLEKAGERRLAPDVLGDLLQVFVKVCDAISFAHSRGIVHRDLKPANVMISDFGQVYVLDWGVALSSPSPSRADEGAEPPSSRDLPGSLLGTPSYMAPEQLRGLHDQIDERTDVYSLGAILYRILAGRPPYSSEALLAIRRGAGEVEIVSAERIAGEGSVPGGLSRIALKALAFNKVDRYPSVLELKRDIEHFLRGTWHLPRVRFAAGATIVREGEPGQTAFIIVEGECVAVRDDDRGGEVLLRRMSTGEVFGETAVLSNKPRTASVRAVTDVVLMEVTAEALSDALGLNSWIGGFVRALVDRFREADERLRQQGS
jgi:serine/threonine-protein kinase